jgi:hypothetical protein
MRTRIAGQEVIAELLREQARVPRRSALGRLFGRSPLSMVSRPWYVGAEGEIAVGRELTGLPTGWTVLHALPVGTRGSDIDHVVIGPGGVFTLNTKHHAGKNIWVARRTFMVNGRKVPYLRNAESEAARLQKMISERMPSVASVQPLLVLVAPKQITIREEPDRVGVLTSRQLRRWLEKQPVVLPEPQLSAVAALLDDPALWATSSRGRGDLSAGFAALDAEVRSARSRRKLWAGAGLVGVGAAAMGGLPLAVQAYSELVLSLMP